MRSLSPIDEAQDVVDKAYVDVKQNAIRSFRQSPESSAPQFSRFEGNPVFTASNQNPASGADTASNIYWPWIIKASVYLESPIDTYYMYYSTDHAGGGIYLATSDSYYGPWTGRGLVYDDTVAGVQTETPSVMWSEDEELFFMYYHQAGVVSGDDQTTMYAQSTDGISWTRQGVAIARPHPNWSPGDGHTGYFKPFRIGDQWVGYHLMGGADYPLYGISYSVDGRDWTIDPRPLRWNSDKFTDGRRFAMNTTDIIQWNGELWWVGFCTNFTSGSTPKDARMAVCRIAPNLRELIGKPEYILYPTVGTNESVNYRSNFLYEEDGKAVLYYQCDNNFNIAEIT